MQRLIDSDLKWIFISGKGGVGKTTTSACISTILSKHKESVLLVSTDPAHSTSDIFSQQFTNEPTIVNGYNNLYCMEYDSQSYIEDKTFKLLNNNFKEMIEFQKFFMNIPGIDEAMGYIALMNLARSYNYSTIIFDTAPTGNTLKLLQYPSLITQSIDKIYKSNMASIFKNFINMLYNVSGNIDDIFNKLKKNIQHITYNLEDPNHTTFISVMIPEFLSVFETERMIQTLYQNNINCDIIIINQVIENVEESKFLEKRKKMQKKYIDMTNDLYLDEYFEIIILPLQEEEIRYPKNIDFFAHKYFTYEDKNMSLIGNIELQSL